MENKEKKSLVGTEILTFKEGEFWIACWARYDIVSQGRTEPQAVERLVDLIGYQCIIEAMDGDKPLKNVPVPSEKLLKRWRDNYKKDH